MTQKDATWCYFPCPPNEEKCANSIEKEELEEKFPNADLSKKSRRIIMEFVLKTHQNA